MNKYEKEVVSGYIKFFEDEKLINKINRFSYFEINNQKIIRDIKKYKYIDPKDYQFEEFNQNITKEEFSYNIDKLNEYFDQLKMKEIKLKISKSKNINDIKRLIEVDDDSFSSTILNNNSKNSLNSSFFRKYQGLNLIGSDTGIDVINNVTDGIFGLTAITGAPGLGKTTLAIQIANYNIKEGKTPIIYITLEVPKDMFMAKLVSNIISVPVKDVLKNYLTYEKTIEKYKALLMLENNQNLYVFDKSDNIGMSNLRRVIKEVEKKHKMKPLVVIDYFQLYHDNELTNGISVKNEKEDVIMEEFISLKNETMANFILIMSKNKQGYKSSEMSSLKGSNALEYGLETILSLENPEDVGDNFVDDINVVLSVMKNRWGENKVFIPLNFDKKESKFKEIKD